MTNTKRETKNIEVRSSQIQKSNKARKQPEVNQEDGPPLRQNGPRQDFPHHFCATTISSLDSRHVSDSGMETGSQEPAYSISSPVQDACCRVYFHVQLIK